MKYEKHVIKEGSRAHVIYWDSNGSHCTCKACEINKPSGGSHMKSIILHEHEIKQLSETGEVTVARPLKWQPLDALPMPNSKNPNMETWVTLETRDPKPTGKIIHCRFCKLGEIRWVKETWKINSYMEGESVNFQYKADGSMRDENDTAGKPENGIAYENWYENITMRSSDYLQNIKAEMDEYGVYTWENGKSPLPWHSASTMPQWASRFNVECTSVKVEQIDGVWSWITAHKKVG